VLAGNCPFPGCREAKLLHLHIKTCSFDAPGGNNNNNNTASNSSGCPTLYNGCEQSRKLLAHYRRCRTIRATQAGQLAGRQHREHYCLVCSLVARQARSMLRPTSSSHHAKASVAPRNKTNNGSSISTSTNFSFLLGSAVHTGHNAKMPPPTARRRFMSPKIADESIASMLLDLKGSSTTSTTTTTITPSIGLPRSFESAEDDFIRTTAAAAAAAHHRARSASHAEPNETVVATRRRSVSCGGGAHDGCETIEEDEESESGAALLNDRYR
jgi:hypothetical protein